MFRDYVIKTLAAKYENWIIIFDFDNIESRYRYTALLSDMGFQIIVYNDATEFRLIYETEIKTSKEKYAILVKSENYVPYDILKKFYCVSISLDILFPNLNKDYLINHNSIELPLLYTAYENLYKDLTHFEETSSYVIKEVYGKNNVEIYIEDIKVEIMELVSSNDLNYDSWISIASKKGKAEYLAAKVGITVDFSFIDEAFKNFILNGYTTISSIIHRDSPVMVSRVMDFIYKKNAKVALIVLDGMSVFDFNVIASEFNGIEYQEGFIYAMVPTTTAISRPSLLSGKFPVELEKPFNLSREEKEFRSKAKSLGYLEKQISYERGYNPDIGPNVKCISIIINDIDDLVHGQLQGKVGMYNDVKFLAKSRKVQHLIYRLHEEGFNVYLTSDHGNTLCQGTGIVKGTGVEVETKSKRMLILKNFADSKDLIKKYNLVEYPGYYLDKQYLYLICNTGKSFDNKNSMVMTHGGISIDEVIVPFIKVKEVKPWLR
ncbi:PglZ domain-containing protein [Bacillus sp. JJ1562]|uniref:PglZ domain-containing protein n=1 Tax=Bacillus sp. JJ1562 TaxID=3122960 RepID=UPI0030021966